MPKFITNFKLQREKQLKNDIYHAWFVVISIFVRPMKLSYSKKEKLKSKKQMDELFSKGHSLSEFPLRMIYLSCEHTDNELIKTAVSVSKRNFKKAVERNLIKRLLREAYRLNKDAFFNNITTQYALMILYIGNDEPSFHQIERSMKKLLQKFKNKIS